MAGECELGEPDGGSTRGEWELVSLSNNEIPCFYHFNCSLGFGVLTEISSLRNICLTWIYDHRGNYNGAPHSDNDMYLMDIKAHL